MPHDWAFWEVALLINSMDSMLFFTLVCGPRTATLPGTMAAATGVIFSSVLSLSSISPLMFEERVECEGGGRAAISYSCNNGETPAVFFRLFLRFSHVFDVANGFKSVFGVMFSTIAAAAVVVVVVVVGVTGSFVDGWC